MSHLQISIIVNGTEYHLETPSNRTLLDILREDLRLTGTKDGCRVGECGACTVLMDGQPVNSCLVLAGQADRHEYITIEGLSKGDQPHPIQKAFMEKGAVQCGFCTPGMVLAAKSLLDQNPNPTLDDIRQALVGNLCRCTGYSKVVEAVQQAAMEMNHE
jgi:carbon-monoxide dehydrogenase small subunit